MFQENNDFQRVSTEPGEVSLAPRVGFAISAASAWDSSFNERRGATEWNIARAYDRQSAAMRDAGVDARPTLDPDVVMGLPQYLADDYMPVLNTARRVLSRGPEFDQQAVDIYDARVEELKAKYPQGQFKTTREMWEEIRQEAQAAEKYEVNRRGTTLGKVGSFAGGVLGFMDVRGGALPAATALISAPGTGLRAVAAEGAIQAGLQAGIESVGGDMQARKALGLEDQSLGGAAQRVLFAGLGGAAIRGAGEGGRAAFGRWFGDTPTDPAPPRPAPREPDGGFRTELRPEDAAIARRAYATDADPYVARTRMGEARVLDDLDEVIGKMDSWSGPRAADVRPDVRMPDDQPINVELSVDDLARVADPDTFRVYDKLMQRSAELREALGNGPDNVGFAQLITEKNNKVVELTDALGDRKLKGPARKELEAQRDAAMAERDAIMGNRTGDTPAQAEMREQLMKTDYKMRDLAPQMSRAYARARGQFIAGKETRDAVNRMVSGRRSAMEPDEIAAIVQGAKDRLTDPGEGGARTGSPLSDASGPNGLAGSVARTMERDVKTYEDNITNFRESVIPAALKDGNDTIVIGTQKFKMNDRLEITNPDGEGSRTVTVREMLEEIRDAEDDLKAMKTCSI